MSRSSQRAFTLLELMLALALLTIVAVMAISLHFDRPQVSLPRAAQLLADDMRLLQSRAISQGRSAAVSFAEDGRGWTTLAPDDGIPPRRLDSDAVFEGVRFEAASLPAGRLLRFDARGMPDQDATLVLRHAGHALVVEVDQDQGLVQGPR
jgi:prepilin-type N-terminal cleavage/methylation domain-containing protein